jgi:anti-sigma factor RsiW
MNCQQAEPLINPYADGELDATRIAELEHHIRACSACALAWRNLQGLRKAVKQDALFFKAPAELRRNVRIELRDQFEPQPRQKWWSWLNVLTTGAAVVCLALLVSVIMSRPSAQQQLAQEIVSSHVRSLMANHAMDVASSDQHTVKPWFDGKIDFAPPVKDLAAREFPLVGGRLDYLGGRAVVALVFQRHKHIINLFIWPDKQTNSKPGALPSIKGYNLVYWSQAGMSFWAVSDLNQKELDEFSQIYASN